MLIRPLQESLQSGRRKGTERGSAGERQGHGRRRLCFLSTPFSPRIFDYIEMICYHKKTPAAEVCVNICHPQKSLFPRAANQRQAHVKSKEYLVLIVSVRVKTVNISIFLSESDNNFKFTGKNKKTKLRNEKSKRRLSGVGFSDIIMWRMEIYTCLTEQEAVWRKKNRKRNRLK